MADKPALGAFRDLTVAERVKIMEAERRADPAFAEMEAKRAKLKAQADPATIARLDEILAQRRLEGWEPPIAFPGQGKRPTFPTDVLPAWMGDHVVASADQLQVPVDLCAQIALGAWAAVCAHIQVAVTARWHEHLNLYTVTAMASGAGKSPADRELTRPLRALEEALIDENAKAVRDAAHDHEILEKKLRQTTEGVVKGSVDRSELEEARLALDAHIVPPMPRLLADDATPEALTGLLHRHGGRMAIVSAEAAIFDMVCGQYSGPGKKANLDVYLKGWGGETLRVDRKGGAEKGPTEIIVKKALLTVSVTVQPSALAELRRHPELAGRGFTARFMYSMPEDMRGYRNRRKILDTAHLVSGDIYDKTFEAEARKVMGWNSTILKLSEDATTMFVEWEMECEKQIAPGGPLRHLSEWMAKLQGSVARVAGLLHLADGNSYSDPVTDLTMGRALVIGSYWIAHACAVAELWGTRESEADGQKVVEWLHANGADEVTLRDIYRPLHLPVEEIIPVVETLIEYGVLSPMFDGPVRAGVRGKPPLRFAVNPYILQKRSEVTSDDVESHSEMSLSHHVSLKGGFRLPTLSDPDTSTHCLSGDMVTERHLPSQPAVTDLDPPQPDDDW